MLELVEPRAFRLTALAALLIVLSFTSAAAQQPSPSPAGKEATVYGMRIHYLDKGSGPVVVLLHGLGGSAQNWFLNTDVLAQKFRVIVPDQLGFGLSDKPFTNYRVGTYVDFLDAFLKELKIERAAVVGNSLGGWIAAAYTLAHPERVERLVLVDAAGFAPPKDFDMGWLAGLNPSTREGMKRLAALVFYNKQLATSDPIIDLALKARLSAGDGYTIQSLNESVARREDMLDNRLSGITQPTLLIWGREDGLTPLAEYGERFKKEIKGAQLLVFEQCGHVPQVEKAAEFNAALLKFLSTAQAN